MTHLLAFALCLAGFAGLALTAARQQRSLFAQPLGASAITVARGAAWAALGVALALLVSAHGWGLGLVMFSGHTSLAAGVVHIALIGWSRTMAAEGAVAD